MAHDALTASQAAQQASQHRKHRGAEALVLQEAARMASEGKGHCLMETSMKGTGGGRPSKGAPYPCCDPWGEGQGVGTFPEFMQVCS